jgi:hypothetical protein
MTIALTNELTPQHTLRDSVKGWNVKNEVNAQYYVPTPPSPVPRAASKFLFNAHPAKHAAIKYKTKLMTKSGVAKPLPIPKAIAVTNVLTTPTSERSAQLIFQEGSDEFRCGWENQSALASVITCATQSTGHSTKFQGCHVTPHLHVAESWESGRHKCLAGPWTRVDA